MKVIFAIIAIGIILYLISLYNKKKKTTQKNNLKYNNIKNSKVGQYSRSYKKNTKTRRASLTSIKPSDYELIKNKTKTPTYPTEVSFNTPEFKYTTVKEEKPSNPSIEDSYSVGDDHSTKDSYSSGNSYTGSGGSFSGSGAGSKYDDDSYRSSYSSSSYSSSYDSSSSSSSSSSDSSSSSSDNY